MSVPCSHHLKTTMRYAFSFFNQTLWMLVSSTLSINVLRNRHLFSTRNPLAPFHIINCSSIHVNDNNVDYFQRAQWLRAALLGANDGLVTASLMMGVGSVKEDTKPMLLIAGFAGLFAAACSMATGEFVSVNTQRDIEMAAQMKREKAMKNGGEDNYNEEAEREKLPNPVQAAFAAAFAFSLGAVLPLLAAAFIREHRLRLSVVIIVATSALVAFGVVGARVGGTPVVKSSVRVLIGGWVAMAITFGLTRLIGSNGLKI